jgi:primosomal protein N' (replication factor Y)
MGQLITQVSGRSGRGEIPGEVLLQTAYQNHPLLQQLIQQGYGPFALSLLQERLEAGLPPHKAMAIVHASASQSAFPFQFLTLSAIPFLNIIGPLPSPLPKKAGLYRAQLIILADNRALLQKGMEVLSQRLKGSHLAKKVRWSLDVDPQALL